MRKVQGFIVSTRFFSSAASPSNSRQTNPLEEVPAGWVLSADLCLANTETRVVLVQGAIKELGKLDKEVCIGMLLPEGRVSCLNRSAERVLLVQELVEEPGRIAGPRGSGKIGQIG